MKFNLVRWLLGSLVLLAGLTAQAQEKTANEIAQELANPNTPLAALNFKLQFREFEGDLPDADGQNGTTLLFHPACPFRSTMAISSCFARQFRWFPINLFSMALISTANPA